MKNSYLEKVENYIKNKSAKKQILSELEAHIEDKTDYYLDIGYEREEAEQKALEEMMNTFWESEVQHGDYKE